MGFFKGHNTTIRSNKISDFSVGTAEYGSPVMEILGTTRITGNVIYYDDFTAHEHRETQKSGKGGRSKTTTITYTYTVACIMGLCEGEISGIGKIWKDKDVYAYPNSSLGLTAFVGSANQKPWAYLTSKHPDKALSYNGLAYVAGVIDLGDSASFPNYNFEVKGKLLNTGDGIDVNPADYIRFVLDKVGLGNVPIDGLDNYRSYCRNADMLISTPSDATSAKSAREIINEIATITNAYMFWSNDRFKIVPLEDRPVGGWMPNKTITYDLTSDDFLPQDNGALVTYARKDSSEVYNQFPVEFLSRDNAYETETVAYELTDDIKKYGLRQSDTIQAHYLYKKSRAVRLAEQLARNAKYGRNQYTFKLDWAFCRLEVGDLVTLTDETCGLDHQPAIINSVTEDADGLLELTAISRPPMDVTEAKYNVHETERPFVDFNMDAPNTLPVIFQPPVDITTTGNEVWIAGKGVNTSWGGCYIYASEDNINYRRVGQLTNSSRLGKLISDISADDTTITVSCNDQLISGSKEDAENGNTLCWIDGECFSYQTAQMDSNGNYTLSGCIRGQYNTFKRSHVKGSDFVRCDTYLAKLPFQKEDIGKKVYFKFCSYNIFGANVQDLADVQPYQYTIQQYYLPPVTGVMARNRYRKQQDGIARYDIVVDWTPPELDAYDSADVWYKTNYGQADDLTFKEGVPADEMGFNGEWIYGGNGKNEVVIPQAIVGDTYQIAVCTKDKYGVSTSPDLSPQTKITVALKTELPNVPDDFQISFGNKCTVTWKEVTNADIAYYEVRDDTSVGVENVGLLARTSGTSATIELENRKGTLYLYARSAVGKYSNAAELQYNKAIPKTPKAPRVSSKLGGMAISAEPIPSGCNGMIVYVSGGTEEQSFKSTNNVTSYLCDAGIYDVKVAFTDIFGEGEKSPATRCTVKVEIDGDMIKDGVISMEKFDNVIQDNINHITDIDNSVLSLNTELSKVQGNITSLQAKDGEIEGLVKDGDANLASQIKQTADSVQTIVTNLNSLDNATQNYSAFKQLNTSIQTVVNDGLKNIQSQVTQNADNITSIVGELNSDNPTYSSISQLKDAVNLRVKSTDFNGKNIISQINLDKSGATIDGKYLHVTGEAKFDKGVIAKNIDAGSITAEKLAAKSLSAMGMNIGQLGGTTGARMTISDQLICVYDENGTLRVRMGIWNDD